MNTKTRVYLKKIVWFTGLTLCSFQSSWATFNSDSWIVRSEVRANSSMWGPGPTSSFNIGDNYSFNNGVFRGGFDWRVALDAGTVVGNAEGVVNARYDNWLSRPGTTNVSLSYSGLSNESNIGTNVGANISIRPYLGANIFGIWSDVAIPVKAVDANLNTGADFTTGLTGNVTNSQRHDLLSLGGDLALLSYGMDVYMESGISFTPELYSGLLNYTHVESGASGTQNVDFWQDGTLDFELNLNRPGHWEFTLEDFYLEQNSFNTQLDLGVKLAVGIPLFGSELAIEPDITIKDSGDFSLYFDSHNLLGDPTLGRFSIYVEPVPVPSAVWLFGSALLGLVGFYRRKETIYEI